MRTELNRASTFSAIIVAALSLSAAGCALTKGNLASRDSVPPPLATSTSPASVEAKPAVLVQNGATAPATTTTVQPTNTANVDSLPQLPKSTTAPVAYANTGTNTASTTGSTKQLTPEEKARVVAELEALARGEPAKPPAAAKVDCTTIASGKTGSAQTAAAGAACASTPKPAVRP